MIVNTTLNGEEKKDNMFNTAERNIQIVLSLLKEHGIKRVIASPGSTDIAIVASMQNDPFFEMYSCVDERSACYMACGMCAEAKEPVVIVCTGATSSRNYMPGLTEAYYRHLPVLAITCCKSNANVGHYVNQVTDRSSPPSDTVNISEYIQTVRTEEDEWDCMIKANRAILGLRFNGGGPCHINLQTVYTRDFSVKEIKKPRVIKRYTTEDVLPPIPQGKIGIFVGSFPKWDERLTECVDRFCEKYDAVVFYDQTSNYKGKYGVLFPLLAAQCNNPQNGSDIDLMIHIGYVSACTCTGKKIWRINADGQIRDTFRRATAIFQMSEQYFFEQYCEGETGETVSPQLYKQYQELYKNLVSKIPELPFSNIWVAQTLSSHLPENSVAHFGILNSLRSWNNFEIPLSVDGYSNTGGFGIDGGVSSMLGASMLNRNKLYFGFFGDLLFYYDMNSLGNRHIESNVRILVVNNGLGQEFRNRSSFASILGEEANDFVAAKGHFRDRKMPVIKNFAESLGFEYLSASSKESFEEAYHRFVTPEITDKPMLFEVFTETEDESEALDMMMLLNGKAPRKNNMRQSLKVIIPSRIRRTIKEKLFS